MNIIDRSALYIAQAIRRHDPDAGSEIALKYSLSLLINTLSAMFITLLVCTMTGHFLPAIIVIFSYTLLRYFSGGAHMNTSISCCILSICTFTILAHIHFQYWYLGIALDLISIIILWIKAPNGIEQVSRVDPKHYPVLKYVCILIVASNFYFQSSLLSAVFFTQALFLTSIVYRFIDLIERR